MGTAKVSAYLLYLVSGRSPVKQTQQEERQMVVAEFSVTPLVDKEIKPYVDAAVEEVKKAGLKYEVDAMGTTMEGDLDTIFTVVKKAHEKVKAESHGRVMTEIRIDDKPEGVTIDSELEGYR
jgi:uncharacterized protein (TIGR00106 family)